MITLCEVWNVLDEAEQKFHYETQKRILGGWYRYRSL